MQRHLGARTGRSGHWGAGGTDLRGFRMVSESLGMTCEGFTRGSIKGGEKRPQDGALRDFDAG